MAKPLQFYVLSVSHIICDEFTCTHIYRHRYSGLGIKTASRFILKAIRVNIMGSTVRSGSSYDTSPYVRLHLWGGISWIQAITSWLQNWMDIAFLVSQQISDNLMTMYCLNKAVIISWICKVMQRYKRKRRCSTSQWYAIVATNDADHLFLTH